MSTKHDDGGLAFPGSRYEMVRELSVPVSYPGMTLRDYFAGQALAGMCHACGWQGGDMVAMARWAYVAAEEMLKARGAEE